MIEFYLFVIIIILNIKHIFTGAHFIDHRKPKTKIVEMD